MIDAKTSLRNHAYGAIALVVLFGGSASAWSLLSSIDGAVVTSGVIVVENSSKKVQHPTGGVVGELNVREGQFIKEGDVVVRLDSTISSANLGIVRNNLNSQRARLARLQAERDEIDEPQFPQDLLALASHDSEVANVLNGELNVAHARSQSRRGQKQQLAERIGQMREEIKGHREQIVSVRAQLKLANEEHTEVSKLFAKGLVPRTRVSTLQREILRSESMIGDFLARIAQNEGRITEIEVQRSQLDRDAMNEVARDIREAETQIGELLQRLSASEDQARRIDIRAPISGYVHQLAVHTIGGVVAPGEALMQIVPETDRLIVEVRVNPMDIDKINQGQETRVLFSAFNQTTTPQLAGKVLRVAPDLTKDPATQIQYYTIGIEIADTELKRLNGLKLMAGMPAEAFIKTGERTFASYLFKPLTDQFHRALREN